ncbi:hypothetical protein PYK79_13430, partial [Streptomyces sp. ID05-04B]|nr:hypothetical protein [Streptomyces sp. ID05-04B]
QRQVQWMCHRPSVRARAYAPCPQCDAYALARTDGRWHIHCTACRLTLTPEDYDQHTNTVLASLGERQQAS